MIAEIAWIMHLCPRSAWEAAQACGVYRPEDTPERGGFIHCARPEQILPVANRYFRGASDLVLLWIDPERVQSEIRWEGAGGELFPHIYGPLNLEAVVVSERVSPDHPFLGTCRLAGLCASWQAQAPTNEVAPGSRC
jgi:uncharacterized protein (DUF952 family)